MLLGVLSLATNAGFSSIWLAIAAGAANSGGQGIASLWRGYRERRSWLVMLASAILPWGLGTLLQLAAQRRVTPTTMQIALAFVPIWSIVFAYAGAVGPSERDVTTLGWGGVAIIMMATVMGSLSGRAKAYVESRLEKITTVFAPVTAYLTQFKAPYVTAGGNIIP